MRRTKDHAGAGRAGAAAGVGHGRRAGQSRDGDTRAQPDQPNAGHLQPRRTGARPRRCPTHGRSALGLSGHQFRTAAAGTGRTVRQNRRSAGGPPGDRTLNPRIESQQRSSIMTRRDSLAACRRRTSLTVKELSGLLAEHDQRKGSATGHPSRPPPTPDRANNSGSGNLLCALQHGVTTGVAGLRRPPAAATSLQQQGGREAWRTQLGRPGLVPSDHDLRRPSRQRRTPFDRRLSTGAPEALVSVIPSATSPTTAYGCSSPSGSTEAPSPGRLRLPPRPEAAHGRLWLKVPLTVCNCTSTLVGRPGGCRAPTRRAI